jgi:hypothetical protein
VAGVALEFVVLTTEYRDNQRDFRRGTIRSPSKPNIFLYVMGFLGIAMVAGGIAKELSADSKIEVAETQIREVNDLLFGWSPKKQAMRHHLLRSRKARQKRHKMN